MFKILLAITTVIFLWLGFSAAADLWPYLRLQSTAPATITQVKIVEISSSEYALRVHYKFAHGKGKATLGKPYHLNRFSAEKAAKEVEKRQWQVWYAPSNPSYNALEKSFPFKKITYFLTAIGIFLYFYFKMQSTLGESGKGLDTA